MLALNLQPDIAQLLAEQNRLLTKIVSLEAELIEVKRVSAEEHRKTWKTFKKYTRWYFKQFKTYDDNVKNVNRRNRNYVDYRWNKEAGGLFELIEAAGKKWQKLDKKLDD